MEINKQELQAIYVEQENITHSAKIYAEKHGIEFTDSFRRKCSKYLNNMGAVSNDLDNETTAETSVADNVQNENVSSDDVQTAEEVTQDSPSETLSETQTEQTIEQDTVVSTQENQPTVTETQQTVFANEELAKINEFVKRTGKGVDDYYALQKTSEQLDKRELLKKYYSEKEGMTEKEVNRELKKFEDVDDEDLVDEDTKELYEIQLEKASKWYDESRESVLASLNAEPISEQPSETQVERYSIEEYQNLYAEQVQKVQQYNNQVIASAIPELEYELEYGGSKENGIEPLKFTYKPDEAFLKEATKVGLDMGVLINDFFENGQVKDPKGLLKVLTKSYAPTNKVMIDKLIEQAVLNDRISRSKSVRNVHNNLYQSVETVADDSNKAAYEAYRKSKKQTPYE